MGGAEEIQRCFLQYLRERLYPLILLPRNVKIVVVWVVLRNRIYLVETKKRHTWIIADTHFNHMKMCDYCTRPRDFNQKIVRHWQRMVAPEDLVYHLGDFYLGTRTGFTGYVNMLPGVKILIKGNHDREKDNWYLNRGFAAVLNFAAVISRISVSRNKECFFVHESTAIT